MVRCTNVGMASAILLLSAVTTPHILLLLLLFYWWIVSRHQLITHKSNTLHNLNTWMKWDSFFLFDTSPDVWSAEVPRWPCKIRPPATEDVWGGFISNNNEGLNRITKMAFQIKCTFSLRHCCIISANCVCVHGVTWPQNTRLIWSRLFDTFS